MYIQEAEEDDKITFGEETVHQWKSSYESWTMVLGASLWLVLELSLCCWLFRGWLGRGLGGGRCILSGSISSRGFVFLFKLLQPLVHKFDMGAEIESGLENIPTRACQ